MAVWVLWGSVYLGLREVVTEVDRFQAMAQRFLVAGTLLGGLVVLRRGWRGLRLTRQEFGALVLTGVLLLGMGNGLQSLALVVGLPTGMAALLVAAVPTWAVLLGLAAGIRPSRATIVGVVIGFTGLVVLVQAQSGGNVSTPRLGIAISLCASVSWAIGSFVLKRLRLPSDVVVIAAYQQVVAAGCSASLAVVSGESFSMEYSTRAWAAMAHLVFACSVVAYMAFA